MQVLVAYSLSSLSPNHNKPLHHVQAGITTCLPPTRCLVLLSICFSGHRRLSRQRCAVWAPLPSCYTLSSIVRVSEASPLLSKWAFAAMPLHVSFLSPSLSWALFSWTASQHVHTLLVLRFFVLAIKDASTGIFWCSTGLPSLFSLSWFNLKSELCSPLYLISSLPVSPLSRSVLSLSVGVQYNDWWMQKTLFFGQSVVTHRKAREQERCAWPFTLWDLMLVGMWGGRGGLWVTGLWRLWCKCTHAK